MGAGGGVGGGGGGGGGGVDDEGGEAGGGSARGGEEWDGLRRPKMPELGSGAMTTGATAGVRPWDGSNSATYCRAGAGAGAGAELGASSMAAKREEVL